MTIESRTEISVEEKIASAKYVVISLDFIELKFEWRQLTEVTGAIKSTWHELDNLSVKINARARERAVRALTRSRIRRNLVSIGGLITARVHWWNLGVPFVRSRSANHRYRHRHGQPPPPSSSSSSLPPPPSPPSSRRLFLSLSLSRERVALPSLLSAWFSSPSSFIVSAARGKRNRAARFPPRGLRSNASTSWVSVTACSRRDATQRDATPRGALSPSPQQERDTRTIKRWRLCKRSGVVPSHEERWDCVRRGSVGVNFYKWRFSDTWRCQFSSRASVSLSLSPSWCTYSVEPE